MVELLYCAELANHILWGCALAAVIPSVALFTFLLPLDDKEILVYS